MALPSIADLKLWVGTLFTKDDWDYNFKKIVGWLSDGSADFNINSAKISNGLDLNGSTIVNMGIATTGTQPITLDQAQTLLNRTSNYIPFTVASGKVNSYGYADFIQKDSDTQVTVLAGNVNPDLVVVQSDGTVESVTSNTVLTVGVADDTYYIIKNKGESITITSGDVTIGRVFPNSPVSGDYFLNISSNPYKGYVYDSLEGWETQEFCLLGTVTVSGGVATVKCRGYNNNTIVSTNVPVSHIVWLTSCPSDCLVCDGSEVLKTVYSNLYEQIGDTFGVASDPTKFKLPNLIGKTIWGDTTAGIEKTAGLPNITGYASPVMTNGTFNRGGALIWADGQGYNIAGGYAGGGIATLSVDASASNGIYGASTTVQPPAVTLIPCIKY